MWRLETENTEMYLLGTIHLMTENVEWFEGRVADRFEAAETLVLEVNPAGMSQSEVQSLVQELAVLPSGTQLSDVVSEETMSELEELFSPLQIPMQAVERWEPWYAALTATNVIAQQAGFSPEYGVDMTLAERAMNRGMPIEGLETVEFQLRLFDDLNREDARYYLEETLAESDMIIEIFTDLRDAWLEENLSELEDLLVESSEENPEFYESIFVERNESWVEELSALIEDGGSYFVAVGAGHMVGEQSVIDLLESRGYDVTDIDG
jgi:hypothetical protein